MIWWSQILEQKKTRKNVGSYIRLTIEKKKSGVNTLLINFDTQEWNYALSFEFSSSNNVTKYEALIVRIKLARSLGATHLKAYTYSQLVANQINGKYEVKDQTLTKYHSVISKLAFNFG